MAFDDTYRRFRRAAVKALEELNNLIGENMQAHTYTGRGDPEQFARDRELTEHYARQSAHFSKPFDHGEFSELAGDGFDLDEIAEKVKSLCDQLAQKKLSLDQFKDAIMQAVSDVPGLAPEDRSEVADRLAKEPKLPLGDTLLGQLRQKDELDSPETKAAGYSARQARVNYSREHHDAAPTHAAMTANHIEAAQRLLTRCPHLTWEQALERVRR